MTKVGVGNYRRLRHLRSAGTDQRAKQGHRKSLGQAVGGVAHRRDRRPADRIPVASRQGAQAVAERHQLSRQYRRAQTRRRNRSRFALGLRLVQGGVAARHVRADRPIRRSHPCAGEFVLRYRLRRARLDGASGVAAAAHSSRRGGDGGRHDRGSRRHLCVHGGSAIFQLSRRASPTKISAIR